MISVKKVAGILLAVCIWMLCILPVAAESDVLAAFSFDNTGAVAEDNIELLGYGDKDKGYNSTTGDAELYASVDGATYRKLEWTKDDYSGLGMQPAMTGGNNHPWGSGAYLEVQVSTLGFKNIAFSAKLGATNKGPRDYQLQYSTDGENFTNVGEVYSLSDNKTLEQAFDNVALPEDAADKDVLYIRIAVVGETLVNGTTGLVGTTSGETAINDIVVNAVATDPQSASQISVGGLALVLIGGGVALIAAVIVIVVVLVVRGRKKAS